jgi:hypothetical protein
MSIFTTQELPGPPSIVVIVGLLLAVLFHIIIVPVFISPLAKIPNAHWSAPISSLWILYTRFKRGENRTLRAAHKRLGPIIRVGPSELSIDDIEMVRTVYGGGYDKPQWYSVFDNYGCVIKFSLARI